MFGVRQAQQVEIALYNMLGQRVLDLYRGIPSAGVTQTVTVDGSELQSGMYVVRIRGKTFNDIQMVTLVK